MDSTQTTQENNPPKKEPAKWFVHLVAIFVQALFGVGNCIGKVALITIPPLIFAFYRELFAGLVLILLCLITRSKFVKKEDFLRLFFVGLCMFGNQVCFIVGLSFAPAHVASIWQTTQPVITVILTLLLHMEKKSWLKIWGVILATSGAMTVSFFSGNGSTGKSILIGSCFFLINCVSSSLFVVVSKPLVKKYPALTITALSYCICSILVMTVAACCYWNKPSAWIIPRKSIWFVLYFIFIHSITTYFLMLWCNKYIDASIISAYSTFQPVSTIIVAMIILKEQLKWGDLGAILILLGLACVVWDSYKQKNTTEVKNEEDPSQSLLYNDFTEKAVV